MAATLFHPIIFALCLLFAWPVCGFAGGEDFSRAELDELRKIFVASALADCPWPKEDAELINFQARPQGLGLPLGSFAWRVTQKNTDCRPGRKTLTAAILKNGTEQGLVKMTGDLKLFGPVVSLKKRLNRNEIITRDDLGATRRDVSQLDPGFIRNPAEAVGKKLRVSLPAGAILYDQTLTVPDLVRRGDKVTIVARSAAVEVSAPGEARDFGTKGEIIRVKNLSSRKEIQARVVESGLVETEF